MVDRPGVRTLIDDDARLFELRAATDLAELFLQVSQPALGRAVLSPIHRRFDDVRGQPDILRARAMLAKIGS